MNGKIRVGIGGLGRAGRQMHIPELALYPELFEVVAGCDRAPDRRQELPSPAEGIRTYAALEELQGEWECRYKLF